MNTDEPKKVSAYEFASIEGGRLWEKLREPKNMGAEAVLVAGSILVLACVVFEGASLLSQALAKKAK